MAGETHHLLGEPQRQRLELRRAMAPQRVDRFADFERVANRPAQRLLHVGDISDGLTPSVGSEGDQRARQRLGFVQAGDEGAAAALHIQQDGVGAGRQLLAHDAARDQRH